MPAAVRVADVTNHGGTVTGPGVPTVLIGGMPAAVAGICTPARSCHRILQSVFPDRQRNGSHRGASGAAHD